VEVALVGKLHPCVDGSSLGKIIGLIVVGLGEETEVGDVLGSRI